MADVMLDLVNENDEIIGQALRSEIHDKGLKHREVHVWFITPDKRIIFQKRAANKETWPNMLDATAGGHVELGMDYDQAALAEVSEETGLNVALQDLVFIDKYKSRSFDEVTGKTNDVFRAVYGYAYSGKLDDLKIEDEMGAGFKAYPVEKLYHPSQETLLEIIDSHIHPSKHHIFQTLEKLVS
jgi:isopentenyl-diphosphate delta-isomerase